MAHVLFSTDNEVSAYLSDRHEPVVDFRGDAGTRLVPTTKFLLGSILLLIDTLLGETFLILHTVPGIQLPRVPSGSAEVE